MIIGLIQKKGNKKLSFFYFMPYKKIKNIWQNYIFVTEQQAVVKA